MSDEDTTLQTSNEVPVEQTTADSQTVEQSADSNVEQTTESVEGETQVAEENKQEKVQEPENKPEEKPEKPISRRSAEYRIKQLVEENKNLKQQQQPVEQNEWEIQADNETQPDIQALIAQEVEKRLHPVISQSSKTADDGEISELFSGDKAGERSSYESKIREMWKLDQYKDVAASDLYKIAKFNDMSKSMDSVKQQAIEDYKKAEREARESSAGGNSNNSNRTGTGKPISQMTNEEFEAHNERVKRGLA